MHVTRQGACAVTVWLEMSEWLNVQIISVRVSKSGNRR